MSYASKLPMSVCSHSTHHEAVMLAVVANRATRARRFLTERDHDNGVSGFRTPSPSSVFPRRQPRSREMPPAISRDLHLAKSRQISGNLGKSRQISLAGGFHARRSDDLTISPFKDSTM